MKQKVIDLFEKEFKSIESKFIIINILEGNKLAYDFISKAKKPTDNDNLICNPGVYVFIGNNSVYRVGRHLSNSRKRVLDHIKNNTHKNGYSINDLLIHPDSEILLFNVINQNDRHWVAAVEIFLEQQLRPLMKSGRLG